MHNLWRRFIVMAMSAVFLTVPALRAAEIRDIVGATHSQGGYTFSQWYTGGNNDYLNEGAAALTQLGTRVIKVWFHPNAQAFYPFTRPSFGAIPLWDTDHRLVTLAQTPQYSTLFSNPNFTTYVLVVLPNNVNDDEVFQDGMTDVEKEQERKAMFNLADYLLRTYGSTNKTFVLQNWEGDHLLRGDCCGVSVPADPWTAVLGMRDWINARQLGVTQARANNPTATAKVVHAAEVNNVYGPLTGNPGGYTMVDDVLPWTQCDLYSYSIWDINHDPYSLTAALDYIAARAPDSTLYGKFNIYIGEYGSGELSEHGGDGVAHKEYIRRMTEIGLGWGVRYMLYWQTFDNYQDAYGSAPPPNSAFSGIWLIRADGTKPPVYDYFQELLQDSLHHVALQASSGYYVSPDEGGGYAIRANAPWIREWEYLTIVDRNGGSLMSNDPVNVMTWRGNYFMAYDGGGGYMDATATHALGWEDFTVIKTSGTGAINFGNTIALRASTGHYAYPMNGGGPGDLFFYADASSIGSWQTFTVRSMGW